MEQVWTRAISQKLGFEWNFIIFTKYIPRVIQKINLTFRKITKTIQELKNFEIFLNFGSYGTGLKMSHISLTVAHVIENFVYFYMNLV